jgi:hypothetical protein
LRSLADKCARTVESHAWHSPPALEARKASKPNADAAAQSSGKKKKKRKRANDNDKPLVVELTTAATMTSGARCPVDNSRCHSADEC